MYNEKFRGATYITSHNFEKIIVTLRAHRMFRAETRLKIHVTTLAAGHHARVLHAREAII